MRDAMSATHLLRQAAAVFDAPEHRLAEAARDAWKRGFASGGEWMRLALGALRKEPVASRLVRFSRLGGIKYFWASLTALVIAGIGVVYQQWWSLPAGALGFYAVEAQMVFLFPLALDGLPRPFSESRRWTRRAGGTWRVMQTVIPIAASMLFGGFAGRGFRRSWFLGCLAILVWYEELRRERSAAPLRPRLEIGATLPLLTRRAQVRISDNIKPVRLLYACDLHCRGKNSRALNQLVDAARQSSPDLIVLGGDLADTGSALPLLSETVKRLADTAPVWAIAGNHDRLIGVSRVRAAVEQGGGNWLGERSILLCDTVKTLSRRGQSLDMPLYLDGAICEGSSGVGRVLCAHDPEIFSRAAERGYSLVLAGHLHGGQCVLAEKEGRLLPGAWFHRWNGTRFERNGSTLLVSRGVSDTLPLRWNCPREILECELF